MRRYFIATIAAGTILLSGCAGTSHMIIPPPPQTLNVDLDLPAGWARNDSPNFASGWPTGHVSPPILAINSWGDSNFCAGITVEGSSYTYGPQTILSQVKPGGVYIVLNSVTCFPGGSVSSLSKEYTRNNLSGVWSPFKTNPYIFTTSFYKRSNFLELWVVCDFDISSDTMRQLNDLLSSWRFISPPP